MKHLEGNQIDATIGGIGYPFHHRDYSTDSMTDWPPDGYSEPEPWEKDVHGISIIGIVLGVGFAYIVRFELIEFFHIMRVSIRGFIGTLGIPRTSPIYVPLFLFTAAVLLYGTFIVFRDVVAPIHEWIHYTIGEFFELNPDRATEEVLYTATPGVICVTTNIPVWQSALVLVGPFVVIGIVSALVVFLLDGAIAGLAAVILVLNSTSSNADIHSILRFTLLPVGTRFANFEEGENQYRSEYAVPAE